MPQGIRAESAQRRNHHLGYACDLGEPPLQESPLLAQVCQVGRGLPAALAACLSRRHPLCPRRGNSQPTDIARQSAFSLTNA